MTFTTSIFSILILAIASSLSAEEVYSGPSLTFTKSSFADPTLEANQDRITDNVWITRADNMGIYNAAAELNYSTISPLDTEWAFSGMNGNPSGGAFVGASNFANLTFDNWKTAHASFPPNTVGVAAVLHLITDDHYIDITFDAWAEGNSGGGFSYTRSTQTVPEPSSLFCIFSFSALACLRRKRQA